MNRWLIGLGEFDWLRKIHTGVFVGVLWSWCSFFFILFFFFVSFFFFFFLFFIFFFFIFLFFLSFWLLFGLSFLLWILFLFVDSVLGWAFSFFIFLRDRITNDCSLWIVVFEKTPWVSCCDNRIY